MLGCCKRYFLIYCLTTALLLVLNWGVVAAAAGRIIGIITDKQSGEPVLGASIMVMGTTRGATTDLEGKYIISQVEPGKYALKVSSVQHTDVEVTDVEVRSDLNTEVNLKLEEKVTELELRTIEKVRRLIVLDFDLDPHIDSLQHLQRDLPEALEPVLAKSKQLETLERKRHMEVLEEIEYQYERKELFNDTTILTLKEELGANVALVGRIQQRDGEIRVDAKLVEIATGNRLVERYIIRSTEMFRTLSQVAESMEQLGKDMLAALEPNSIKPVTTVQDLLKQVTGVVSGTEGEIFIRGGRAGEVSYILCGVPIGTPLIYRLIVLDFEVDPANANLRHLGRDIPEALEPVLAKSVHVVTLEREEYRQILEEIEYQWERKEPFDETTLLRLKKELGVDAVVIGRIQEREGEIRVDAKIVDIVTTHRLVEKFIIAPREMFASASGVAELMEQLGNMMLKDLIRIKAKWPLTVSLVAGGVSAMVSAVAIVQLSSKDNNEGWEDVLLWGGVGLATSSIFYLIYRHKYNKSRQRLKVGVGIGVIEMENPGMYVTFNF